MSEEEWRQLIEYLAGDPETPMGKLRTQHRDGDTTPWTDVFEKIIIECDNETWNFSFAWCFPGDPGNGINRAEQSRLCRDAFPGSQVTSCLGQQES